MLGLGAWPSLKTCLLPYIGYSAAEFDHSNSKVQVIIDGTQIWVRWGKAPWDGAWLSKQTPPHIDCAVPKGSKRHFLPFSTFQGL